MRSQAVALLATCLVLAAASSALAQVPTPDPADERTWTYEDIGPSVGSGVVQRPQDGFAVTSPEHWVVREVTPEGHRLLFGPEDDTPFDSTVVAAMAAG